MTSLVSTRAVTSSVVDALTDFGLVVGDGTAPTGGGWQGTPGQSPFAPYVVVHPLTGGSLDGTLANPNEFAAVVMQVSAWGATREQAEWGADAARRALLAHGAVTEPDRDVFSVTVDVLAGCWLDDTVRPPLWGTGDRFRIRTVPT
jgi:hypothetical protein